MEFKKGQKLQWCPGGVSKGPVGVIYGPVRRLDDYGYLVKHLEGRYAGTHSLVGAGTLVPLAPQVGDKGKLSKFPPLRVIRAINDDYVVMEHAGFEAAIPRFVVHARADFDTYWEPQS